MVGALMIGGGMVGAIITGVYVDKTKKFEMTAKMSFTVAVLGVISFCTVIKSLNHIYIYNNIFI